MRKVLIVLIMIILGLLGGKESSACVLKIYPPSFEVKQGQELTFRLERYPTHKRCVLPIEETKITVSGGTVIDPGTWKEGNPDILEFKVRFDKEGDALVRAERNCPREGLIVIESKGKVIASPTASGASLERESAPQAEETPSTLATTTEETPSTSATTTEEMPLKAPTVNVTTPAPEAPKESSVNITHLSKSINLNLWYLFFAVGLIALLSNLTNYRKPLLFLSAIFLGFYLGGCPEPVGSIFYLLSRNKELSLIALLLFAIPIGMSFLWGRAFCGWMCPLGAVQELIYGARPHLSCYRGLPPWIDRPLKWAKFAILIGFGYLTWQSATNVFSKYEPFKVLFNFAGTPLGIGILSATMLLSALLSRPFCRYICPLGAILKITAPFSRFKVVLDEGSCVGCGLCTTEGVCPMGAIRCKGEDKKPVIDYGECIVCLECKETCKKGGLKLG